MMLWTPTMTVDHRHHQTNPQGRRVQIELFKPLQWKLYSR